MNARNIKKGKKQNVYSTESMCEEHMDVCVFVCEVVDHGLFLSPLQQLPSIFITSQSNIAGWEEGEEERRGRNEDFSVCELKARKWGM